MSSDGEGFMEAYSSMAKNPGYTEETLNLSMTAKQPPSYDGKVGDHHDGGSTQERTSAQKQIDRRCIDVQGSPPKRPFARS